MAKRNLKGNKTEYLRTSRTQIRNPAQEDAEFRRQVFAWYDRHGRDLPWRIKGDGAVDGYKVWLSEIMLQQTTVAAVKSYYKKFLDRWPTIESLAASERQEVMNEWAGLGYYARARNMHECAKLVTSEYGGQFSDDILELRKLPGIGEYTSAALISILHKKPAVVVDANIERVIARLFAIETPLQAAKSEIKKAAEKIFMRSERPADLPQALMDLGALICTPKNPQCTICPVNGFCRAQKEGIANDLPQKIAKSPKPQKVGFVYKITNDQGQILLEQRPDKGLLSGMIGMPTSDWIDRDENSTPSDLRLFKNSTLLGDHIFIRHGFTHFDLDLHLKEATVSNKQKQGDKYFWVNLDEFSPDSLPTVFRKAFRLFREHKS